MKRVFFGFYAFILAAIFLVSLGISPLVNSLAGRYMEKQLTVYYQDLAKGVYFLLMRELEGLPEEEWAGKIDELQLGFGYPIAILPCEEAGLTPGDLERVRAGAIVVDKDGNLFHRQIPGSDYVLRMMTRQAPELPPKWEVGLWAFLASVLALFTLVWSIPFCRRLESIRKAANNFGNGQLQARVKIPERSSLAVIATAFNHMADRIVRLIDSQKELIRAVSHELRTPVARIRFGIEMMGSAPDREARERHAAGIQQDIDELDALVAELLAYNRLDHQASGPRLEEHALLSWAQRIVGSVAEANDAVSFLCKSGTRDEAATGAFDPRSMGRALRNLLQNGARHAASRVEVEVGVDRDMCTVHVDDDGPGIAEQDRERIFEPFVRVDPSRDRDSGGHGLGLAIVRQIAVRHGGKATADRAPIGGARFTLRWPNRLK